jgi:uncharacterized SAM-binding protein YcdF (DUF218 family)
MMQVLRIAALVILVALVAGFAVFAEHTTRRVPPDPLPRADGVVALTGAGGARLATAMALLEQGAASRLLITGVNPTTTDEDVRRIANGSQEKFDCCVDLDRAARTTVGNAREAAAWARERGYRSLILVTSDFHMPRSLLELERAEGMSEVEIMPYPVRADSGRPWWRDLTASRRLATEYVKFLAALALDSIGMRKPPEEEPVVATADP